MYYQKVHPNLQSASVHECKPSECPFNEIFKKKVPHVFRYIPPHFTFSAPTRVCTPRC